MAKLILLLLFFASCASNDKKDEDYGLSVKMRDKLFAEQTIFEQLTTRKDQLFFKYKPNKCLKEWSKSVEALKQKLKTVVKNKGRQKIWFDLGNCYLLVGENKLAMYYYDLVLGLNFKNKPIDSAIYFNMGQMYENSSRDFLAYSYYKLAMQNNDYGRYSLLKLAMLEFRQGEFSASNKYLTDLMRMYPKSELLLFLQGVNYFHLGRKRDFLNKVLSRLDEKSVSRILLDMALDLAEGKNLQRLESDLNNLEVTFSIHQQFKGFLLDNIE